MTKPGRAQTNNLQSYLKLKISNPLYTIITLPIFSKVVLSPIQSRLLLKHDLYQNTNPLKATVGN